MRKSYFFLLLLLLLRVKAQESPEIQPQELQTETANPQLLEAETPPPEATASDPPVTAEPEVASKQSEPVIAEFEVVSKQTKVPGRVPERAQRPERAYEKERQERAERFNERLQERSEKIGDRDREKEKMEIHERVERERIEREKANREKIEREKAERRARINEGKNEGRHVPSGKKAMQKKEQLHEEWNQAEGAERMETQGGENTREIIERGQGDHDEEGRMNEEPAWNEEPMQSDESSENMPLDGEASQSGNPDETQREDSSEVSLHESLMDASSQTLIQSENPKAPDSTIHSESTEVPASTIQSESPRSNPQRLKNPEPSPPSKDSDFFSEWYLTPTYAIFSRLESLLSNLEPIYKQCKDDRLCFSVFSVFIFLFAAVKLNQLVRFLARGGKSNRNVNEFIYKEIPAFDVKDIAEHLKLIREKLAGWEQGGKPSNCGEFLNNSAGLGDAEFRRIETKLENQERKIQELQETLAKTNNLNTKFHKSLLESQREIISDMALVRQTLKKPQVAENKIFKSDINMVKNEEKGASEKGFPIMKPAKPPARGPMKENLVEAELGHVNNDEEKNEENLKDSRQANNNNHREVKEVKAGFKEPTKETHKDHKEALKEQTAAHKEPIKEPQPIKEPHKEPIKEPHKEPMKEILLKEPIKESLKEPVHKEPIKEPSRKEPIKEVHNEEIIKEKHPNTKIAKENIENPALSAPELEEVPRQEEREKPEKPVVLPNLQPNNANLPPNNTNFPQPKPFNPGPRGVPPSFTAKKPAIPIRGGANPFAQPQKREDITPNNIESGEKPGIGGV